MESIRTTVTLDKDLVQRLKDEAQARHVPFKRLLNETLRSGLDAITAKPKPKPFKIKPVHAGMMPGVSYDNIEALIEYAEGPYHR